MKKLVKNNALTTILLVAAILLLVLSGVQTSRAALTYVSENYTAQVDTRSCSVALLENGAAANGVLLSNLTAEGEEPLPGVRYPESLAVQNTGTIDSYVRVIVHKYWVDADGKRSDLTPDLIGLEPGSGWTVDTSAETPERSIYYYSSKLAAGQTTPPFITAVTLDNSLRQMVTTTTEGNVETTVFNYNGVNFAIEAEVNAVQTHNAKAAIKSAWGINVSINGDSISVN